MPQNIISRLNKYHDKSSNSPELKALLQGAIEVIEQQSKKQTGFDDIKKIKAVFSEKNDAVITSIQKMDNDQELEFIPGKQYDFEELYVGIADELGGYWLVAHGEVEIALLDKNNIELTRL